MKELVFIKKEDCFTNSLIISEGIKISHSSLKKLIKKYYDRIKSKGTLRISNLESTGGRCEEIYWLNQNQTIFLISLCKNTDEVVDFKDHLSSAFI